MTANASSQLLIEFLTEELPPINLENSFGKIFSASIEKELNGFINPSSVTKYFVTPRRFGVSISDINLVEASKSQLRKGPAINNGLVDGVPNKALLGFMKSCDVEDVSSLIQNEDGYFYANLNLSGRKLEEVLIDAINLSLKRIPIAKNMIWGDNDYQFVRPVHNLMIMHGDQVLCTNQQIMGLTPNNYTYGHRFMSEGEITIPNACDYTNLLETKGAVIVDFAKRRALIEQELNAKAKGLNLTINPNQKLLDEVCALVEYPQVLLGEFDLGFLEVPKECLILTMAKNQRYFALLDHNNNLSNKFLFVSNIKSKQPQVVVNGNQKVLSARLSDAKFFYEVDQKHPLDYYTAKLAHVVYHNVLGSQLDRVMRLQNIASKIAPYLQVDAKTASEVAYIIKADLTTEMVGEFPELQGIMGSYYAKMQGSEVALAIKEHYYPRFSGDGLPTSALATTMALSDKLESLVGIWGVGLAPTGEKDPFALRRQALGVVRILLKHPLELDPLLEIIYQEFAQFKLNPNTVQEVRQYIIDRLQNYLTTSNEYNFTTNSVLSVLAQNPRSFYYLPQLLITLDSFAKDSKNTELLNANKRIENILSQIQSGSNQENQVLSVESFKQEAEINLHKLYLDSEPQLNKLAKQKKWNEYFKILANFNQGVAEFFNNVMVMDPDVNLRNNRITLLMQVYQLLNQYCKLSTLI